MLWAGLATFNIVSIFFLQRGQTAGVRSFIERQIWSIWTTFMAGMVLLALLNYLLGLDRFHARGGVRVFASAFSVMGALMGRVWYAAAVFFALAALGMTRVQEHAFTLLGGLWFAVQFGGGLSLHLARRRRLAARGSEARLV
ncbi:hypothetical protein ACFQFH_03660 [Halobaculum halobium]